jgi:hypothetical protein
MQNTAPATRTAAEAKLIIDGILILLGFEEGSYIAGIRRSGAVNVVALDDETDARLIENADRIAEVSANAGSRFDLDTVKGFPVLTNLAAVRA